MEAVLQLEKENLFAENNEGFAWGGRAIRCLHWQDHFPHLQLKHSNTHSVCNSNVDCYAPALCFIPIPRASAFCCKICHVMLKEFLFSTWCLRAEMSTWDILFASTFLWFQVHAWSVLCYCTTESIIDSAWPSLYLRPNTQEDSKIKTELCVQLNIHQNWERKP